MKSGPNYAAERLLQIPYSTLRFAVALMLGVGSLAARDNRFRLLPAQAQENPLQAGSANATPQTPNFAGSWKLNMDDSDDVQAKLKGAGKTTDTNSGAGYPGGYPGGGGSPGGGYPGGGYPGGGYPGRFPGGGGYPGGGYPGGGNPSGRTRPNPGTNEADLSRLRQALEPADRMTASQTPSEVQFRDVDQNQLRTLLTDGRKPAKPGKDSNEIQLKAQWTDGKLVTEEKGPDGEKISKTYEIAEGGRRLYETIAVDGKRLSEPVSIRFVYTKE